MRLLNWSASLQVWRTIILMPLTLEWPCLPGFEVSSSTILQGWPFSMTWPPLRRLEQGVGRVLEASAFAWLPSNPSIHSCKENHKIVFENDLSQDLYHAATYDCTTIVKHTLQYIMYIYMHVIVHANCTIIWHYVIEITQSWRHLTERRLWLWWAITRVNYSPNTSLIVATHKDNTNIATPWANRPALPNTTTMI